MRTLTVRLCAYYAHYAHKHIKYPTPKVLISRFSPVRHPNEAHKASLNASFSGEYDIVEHAWLWVVCGRTESLESDGLW
jgi:hypothetical protein